MKKTVSYALMGSLSLAACGPELTASSNPDLRTHDVRLSAGRDDPNKNDLGQIVGWRSAYLDQTLQEVAAKPFTNAELYEGDPEPLVNLISSCGLLRVGQVEHVMARALRGEGGARALPETQADIRKACENIDAMLETDSIKGVLSRIPDFLEVPGNM